MGSGDFLRNEAQTPHTENYLMAGALGAISTNSPDILAAARDSFFPAKAQAASPRLHWRFWVDPQGTTQGPWPKPTYRGLDHLVFGGLDRENSFLLDLKQRRAIGRFSPALAADHQRWKTILFPNLLTLMGPAVGVTGLHCACVVRDGKGLLLTGASGCGKSTLTLALGRAGFSFLSDDWTYFSHGDDDVQAWGLIPNLKLLPSAARHFPELEQFPATVAANGEAALQIDPHHHLGIARARTCEPRELVFLERTAQPEFRMTRMAPADAVSQLEENLLADSPEAINEQLGMVHRLVERGPWRLQYGEPPGVVATKLAAFFGGRN